LKYVAVHGLPLGPRTWERVPDVEPVALRGLATPEPRDDWSLGSFVEEIAPRLGPDVILVGHDLGGVVAAMAALSYPVAGVVLSGTALGSYWAMVRATTLPGLRWAFYERHAGRRFLAGGVGEAVRNEFVEAMAPDIAAIPDFPARMAAVAREMKPPRGLARDVAQRVPVRLIWGLHDRWYPQPVAFAISRATGAPVRWIDAGHYAMWERPDAWAAALREG
jgi:pimeloyl-ACP methyl ester carboxylesterase